MSPSIKMLAWVLFACQHGINTTDYHLLADHQH